MASVILAGTPAIVVGVGGGPDGITSVVGGLYTSVDNTVQSAPVVNSTLVAGDGIEISAGITQAISANLAAGAGITVTPPVNPGDPITIAATGGGVTSVTGGVGVAVTGAPATPAVALNFSLAAAENVILTIGPTGIQLTSTTFTAAYTGWYIFQTSIQSGVATFAFPAGSSIQFYIQNAVAPSVPDENSTICYTSASVAPVPALLGFLDDTRIAIVHLGANVEYQAQYQFSAGINLGTDIGAICAQASLIPLFA